MSLRCRIASFVSLRTKLRCQLLHGAIVAREYGLPAVVNVAGATQRIADGQMITVYGGNG